MATASLSRMGGKMLRLCVRSNCLASFKGECIYSQVYAFRIGLERYHISTFVSYQPSSSSLLRELRTVQLLHKSRVHHGTITHLNDIVYNKIADETLEELNDFFEGLGDAGLCASDYDVEFGNGVLTIKVGEGIGTYVINKQAPNKQIWLSSPVSGPKRYDVINGRWTYPHDGVALHDLLTDEFSNHLGSNIDFSKLNYSHLIMDSNSWA